MTEEEKTLLDVGDMALVNERIERELTAGQRNVAGTAIEAWSERVGWSYGLFKIGSNAIVTKSMSQVLAGADPEAVIKGVYTAGITNGWYAREALATKRAADEDEISGDVWRIVAEELAQAVHRHVHAGEQMPPGLVGEIAKIAEAAGMLPLPNPDEDAT